MSEVYDLKKAIANKMINKDGTITDLQGNPVSSENDTYKLARAIPNKVLMPDGTYSTLSEIIGSGGEAIDLFVVVSTLPDTGEDNKIYLVPSKDVDGTFDEYYYNENGNWDQIGKVSTVPMISFDTYPSLVTRSTTIDLINSIKELDLPVGTLLLGSTELTDLDWINPDMQMGNQEMRVEIYPNKVIRLIATSTDIPPYQWTYQYKADGQNSGWIATVIPSGAESQTIDTDLNMGAGKSIEIQSKDSSSSSTLSANMDGTIKVQTKVRDEVKIERLAYISDIEEKITGALGGEY